MRDIFGGLVIGLPLICMAGWMIHEEGWRVGGAIISITAAGCVFVFACVKAGLWIMQP